MTDSHTLEPRHQHHELSSGVSMHAVHWEPAEPTLPPCLLVHGLASNARLWDGVARRLAALGHRVVAIDQRGHGHSSKPDGPFDMASVADDLRLLITELGWQRPLIAGQSWGGNVVIEFAHRHPGAASVIVCVDGGSIELQRRMPDWEVAKEQMAPPSLIGTPIAKMREWMTTSNADWPAEGIEGQLANFEVRDDGTIAPWLTLERHLLVLRGLWEHMPSDLYASITDPVLWISADNGQSEWTEAKRAGIDAAVSALATSRSEWFSPAHHDVHAQHPVEVAALLHGALTDPDFF
jgi:pimeloyl-ACP methyl ester carboxylesterase